MQRFLTKGVLSALLASVCFWLSQAGWPALAQYLNRPEFLDSIFLLMGTVFTIVAGVSDGIKRDQHPEAYKDAPQTPDDPYPGYDYDPIKGWVRTDGN